MLGEMCWSGMRGVLRGMRREGDGDVLEVVG